MENRDVITELIKKMYKLANDAAPQDVVMYSQEIRALIRALTYDVPKPEM